MIDIETSSTTKSPTGVISVKGMCRCAFNIRGEERGWNEAEENGRGARRREMEWEGTGSNGNDGKGLRGARIERSVITVQ